MAWVSHKYKICFIENAKCGSSSLKHALQIKPIMDDIPFAYFQHVRNNSNPTFQPIGFGGIPFYIYKSSDELLNKFYSPDLLKGNFLLGKPRGKYKFSPFFSDHTKLLELYSDYKFVTNIRDPWKRLISCFRMFTDETQPFRNLQRSSVLGSSPFISFNGFVNTLSSSPNHHFSPFAVKVELIQKVDRNMTILCESMSAQWPKIDDFLNLPSFPKQATHNYASRSALTKKIIIADSSHLLFDQLYLNDSKLFKHFKETLSLS